ncbi:NAD(+) hydrolase sarm1-like [Saccostrea cucullata]|uniref:NAD(+) hydrolase sarm1-like n=1 Tax=Saccostrea cuccullata TaxID=36930 RepID=UPI002ED5AB17
MYNIQAKTQATRSSESSMESVDAMDGSTNTISRPIDVFISYRRVNGSQLASLLKVHLQLRGFSVFLDIEKLKAGKFDENLLNSVRLAKNFILVLTPNALDRCMGDDEQNDWVHKEIVAAMENGCNIIPLLDSFHWPPSEKLPQDMRQITFFNGIRWIHDYQDACVDKLEKFLRGEISTTHKRAALFQMGSSSEGVVDGGKYSSSEESSPSIDVSPNRDVSYSS